MKITALVENTTQQALRTAHGLSLYIRTKAHRLLFDLGPDDTLFENAAALGIDLAAVDTVVLSHGHNDHGGALACFLAVNDHARVYVQRKAFEPHYSHAYARKDISIYASLARHPQVVCVNGDLRIDDELSLITANGRECLHSTANDTLLGPDGPDNFAHEQSLLIREDCTALVLGCGHRGVVTILQHAAPVVPDLCVGGFHLYNPGLDRTVAPKLLDDIACELQKWPRTAFYTCHCTGTQAYAHLAKRLPALHYLHCGDTVEA